MIKVYCMESWSRLTCLSAASDGVLRGMDKLQGEGKFITLLF